MFIHTFFKFLHMAHKNSYHYFQNIVQKKACLLLLMISKSQDKMTKNVNIFYFEPGCSTFS